MKLSSWPHGIHAKSIVPILCGLTALFSSLSASSGIVLDAGYKIEGEFSGFVPTGNQLTTKEILPGIFFNQKPQLSVTTVFNNTFAPTNDVLVEIFSDNLQQSPLLSGEFYGTGDVVTPNTNFGLFWFDGCPSEVWPDLKGAYRITMLSGSADLHALNIRTYNNRDEYTLSFNSFPSPVSVPEPACLYLLVLGTSILLLRQN